MVESGKSFVKKIQEEGGGAIFGQGALDTLREVRQIRQQDLSNIENELGNTTDGNTSFVGKVADKIVNSNVGQKLVGVAEAVPEKVEDIKAKVGTYYAGQTAKLGAAYTKSLSNKMEKERLISEDIYEDTAKLERVAGVNEEGEQNIKSQARRDAEALALLEKYDFGAKKLREAFPQYRETIDGKRQYRTDGQYIIDKPVGYTVDMLDVMQDAYNSVTYAYANDGVVLTPDDLKKAYPEYKNISDGTLSNFISGCLYDVQNGKRSDIQTVGDYMGEMALADGYTNRMDGFIDVLSDESFMKWSMDRQMSKNKEGEIDMWNAGSILKELANQIREVGAFNEGQSDWSILSTYRNMDNEYGQLIDKYMTLLEEQESHEGITAFVANLYNNYKGNVAGAKTDLKDKDFTLRDTQRIAVQTEMEKYRDGFAKIVEEMRQQSEDETRYPMKNFLEYTVLGKYVRDNNGNYYLTGPLKKQKLAYSRQDDGTYMDAEGHLYTEEQVRAMTAGGLANGMLSALTSIADKGTEAFVDASRIGTAYQEGGLKATTQYDFALAGDLLSSALGVIMVNPMVQMEFNAPIVGPAVSWGFDLIMEGLGSMAVGLLEEIGVAEGWTTESKEKTQEMLGVLGLMAAHKTLKVGKEELKRNPKMRATKKAIDSFVRKIFKKLDIRDVKKFEKMIEEMNVELERQKEERQKSRFEQQQKADTTLAQDVRAGEKSDKIIEKETEKKKEEIKAEGEKVKETAEIPFFTFLKSEIAKAKSEFFDEFYEEYKKEVGGEENMDQNVVLQKDLNDMADPEKREQLIKKYNELFLQEELDRYLEDWLGFGDEIMALKREILEGIRTEQEKQQMKTAKEVQSELAKGKKPTKKYEKIERKDLKLPGDTKTEIRENPFRYILKDILNEFIKPIKNRRGDIIRYERKKNISRVEVQERIMEKWKDMAQQYMNKLQENKKKIFDFQKEFFDKNIDYDIKDFFTKFLKETGVDNILSKLFKDGELSIEETYDENGNSVFEIVYRGEQRMPTEYAREAIDMFNDMFKELQKYWKDGKLLLDEASLYELRSMMKRGGFTTSGKEKSGKFADVAQDLYTIFNDYLDTYREKTGIGKDIRPYDSAFGDYFELMDLLDGFFNGEGEIKKESRNRLINIAEKAGSKLDLLDKLIPGTKEILKLMETGHDFITDMVTFMEKTDYKTWFGRRVLKYGPMMLSAIALKSFLPFWLSAVLAIPVGETIGEKIRNLLGRKRPSVKNIEEVLKQLDLTEDEIKLLKEKRPKDFEKTLDDLDKNFDEKLRELFGDYERGRQEEEGPRAYDREGNEVIWTDEEGNSPDTTSGGPTEPTPPSTPKAPEEPTHNSAEEMEKELNQAEDDTIAGKLDIIDQTSQSLENIIKDFIGQSKDKKEAKLRIAAAGLKVTNSLLSLVEDTPKIKKAKARADRCVKNADYEYLKELIEKTTGDERMIYTNALYKLMLAGKAPTADVKIDFDYVSDKKEIKTSAGYSTEGDKIAEREQEKAMVKGYDSRGEGYKGAIKSIVTEMLKKDLNEPTDEMIDKSNASQFFESESYDDTRTIYDTIYNDVMSYYGDYGAKDKTTTREQSKNIRIKEKEGERLEAEVGLLSSENIKSREDLWFSFDKFGSNKTKTKDRLRYNDKGQRIVNKEGKDYIDGGVLYGTAEIEWGKDEPTKISVSDMEIFDNIPSLNNLPEDTIILDKSSGKTYTMDEIKKMDFKGETNKKELEKYYEEMMKSYPEDIQEIFNS